MSDEYTHTGLELVGRHLPETHMEVLDAHTREKVELPGTYEIGVLIEGAFVRLALLKAGEVLERIEAAKSSRKSDPPAPTEPPVEAPPPSEPPPSSEPSPSED